MVKNLHLPLGISLSLKESEYKRKYRPSTPWNDLGYISFLSPGLKIVKPARFLNIFQTGFVNILHILHRVKFGGHFPINWNEMHRIFPTKPHTGLHYAWEEQMGQNTAAWKCRVKHIQWWRIFMRMQSVLPHMCSWFPLAFTEEKWPLLLSSKFGRLTTSAVA